MIILYSSTTTSQFLSAFFTSIQNITLFTHIEQALEKFSCVSNSELCSLFLKTGIDSSVFQTAFIWILSVHIFYNSVACITQTYYQIQHHLHYYSSFARGSGGKRLCFLCLLLFLTYHMHAAGAWAVKTRQLMTSSRRGLLTLRNSPKVLGQIMWPWPIHSSHQWCWLKLQCQSNTEHITSELL
jgi:hypothetical protein